MVQLYHFWVYTCRNYSQQSSCKPMVITALFTIAMVWNQPRYLSTDEWIKKMWSIYTLNQKEGKNDAIFRIMAGDHHVK
jgi:hypothetical protein